MATSTASPTSFRPTCRPRQRRLLEKLHLVKRPVATRAACRWRPAEPVAPAIVEGRGPHRALRRGDRRRRRQLHACIPAKSWASSGRTARGRPPSSTRSPASCARRGGSMSLGDRRIDGWTAARRSKLGLRRSFQSLELFEDISVEDNIQAGSDAARFEVVVGHRPLLAGHARPQPAPPSPRSVSSSSRTACRTLPGVLPYGRRRLVGIARAVASGPSIVMLDEPAAGLDEAESARARPPHPTPRRPAQDGRAPRRARRRPGDVDVRPDRRDGVRSGDRRRAHPTRFVPIRARARRVPRHARTGRKPKKAPPSRGSRTMSARGSRSESPAGDMLEARGLSCGYGGMSVVRDLDLPVVAGEVAALIGPNGAGKTTTLLTLAGALRPISGEVRWLGEPTTAPMHQRCSQGLSYVTEERSVIMKLTTKENLRLANVPVRGRDLAVPGARAALEAPGRPALGRRATDAGRRPRPRPQSHGDAARRAVARTRTDHRPAVAHAPCAPPARSAASVCCSSSSTFAKRSRSPTAST